MQISLKRRSLVMIAGVTASALTLSACGGGDEGGTNEDGSVTLSFLVDNSETSVALGQGLADAFHEANPDITVEVEERPQGADGDNVVKTRLSTGDMTDVFAYNSGSLFQALNPAQTMVPLEGDYVDTLADAFKQSVTAEDKVYGVPLGTFMGGGILYNIPAYEKLGLEVPKTWADFEANSDKIKEAGKTAVIQTYGDTWTSQLLVLGDFHNVSQAEPSFADDYTAGKAKYADTPAALVGFEHTQEVNDKGWANEDFASAKMPDGMRMLAEGEGVQYPMLTFAMAEVAANYKDQLNDIGFFGIPGDDEATNGATVWSPGGIYIPATTEGAKLDAAKKFVEFAASPDGCQAQIDATPPQGPMGVTGCELPEDVTQVVKDIQTYVDTEGASSPALEFLSPIKGPALEQILVEVGSGIRPADDGAALYDEDAKKQAQQLGIEGW
jgi:raffinose/stachyose/melibiose transport system substrate-binding protein